MVETMVGILIGLIVIGRHVQYPGGCRSPQADHRRCRGCPDHRIAQPIHGRARRRQRWRRNATTPGADLIKRTNDEAGTPLLGMPVTRLDAAVRPVPVLVTDGGAPGVSDSFIALNAGAPHVMWPVDFTATSAAGAPITVRSPNGFTVPPPAIKPYWAIVMANDDSGRCKLVRIVAATTADSLGHVVLTQGGPATTIAYEADRPAKLLNLGPVGTATRIRYDIDAANAALRTTDLLTVPPATPTAVLIAQNVVLMKVQYGVGTAVIASGAHDGIVDTLDGRHDGLGLQQRGQQSFGRICSSKFFAGGAEIVFLAARIASWRRLPVDFGTPDQSFEYGPRAEAHGLDRARGTNLTCSTVRQIPMCTPGLSEVGLTGQDRTPDLRGCLPAIICDYWRYRTYEVVVPVRNAIYSATLPP